MERLPAESLHARQPFRLVLAFQAIQPTKNYYIVPKEYSRKPCLWPCLEPCSGALFSPCLGRWASPRKRAPQQNYSLSLQSKLPDPRGAAHLGRYFPTTIFAMPSKQNKHFQGRGPPRKRPPCLSWWGPGFQPNIIFRYDFQAKVARPWPCIPANAQTAGF